MRDWYKKAIIYSLDIESYRDGGNDGIGDFDGLRQSIPYLSSLGVNCIWLLPIFETPNKDNGYDVSNYFRIDERLGDLGTFTEFMNIANEYNLKVLIDLVVNHTSVEHDWFKKALKDPDSKYYNYYIWADEIPEDFEGVKAFGSEQAGNWEYVEELDKYYYHTFHTFQPDLNYANPEVRQEVKRIMHFWLKQGIAGFRMDAVTFLTEKKYEKQEFDIKPREIIKELRDFVEEYSSYSILLAEADVNPAKYSRFFAKGEGMQMLFNFYGNNYFFYSLAIEKAAPLVNAFKTLPKPEQSELYANFIRNHDELNLEQLTDEEMKIVFERFAKEPDMRIYGRGIRRRFQSMVNGDRKLLELSYSLLMSLPGIPVLRYGQEIGMGDKLSLPGRQSVRTLMQWSNGINGGFSQAPKEKLARPTIEEGPYRFENLNVNEQLKNKNSFLNWLERAITARRRCPEFGTGQYLFLDTEDDEVMIHCCKTEAGTAAVAIHNFGNDKKLVKLDLEEEQIKQLIDIFGNKPYPDLSAQQREVEVTAKGYRWFRTGF